MSDIPLKKRTTNMMRLQSNARIDTFSPALGKASDILSNGAQGLGAAIGGVQGGIDLYSGIENNNALRASTGAIAIASAIVSTGDMVASKVSPGYKAAKAAIATGETLIDGSKAATRAARFLPVVGGVLAIAAGAASIAKNSIAADDARRDGKTGKAIGFAVMASIDCVCVVLDAVSTVADFFPPVGTAVSFVCDLISTILGALSDLIGVFVDLFDPMSAREQVQEKFDEYLKSDALKNYLDDLASQYGKQGYDVLNYMVDAESVGIGKQVSGASHADLTCEGVTKTLVRDMHNLNQDLFMRRQVWLDTTGTGNSIQGGAKDDLVNIIRQDPYWSGSYKQINGSGGNDKLYGGLGGDIISGGAGNDVLDGRFGPDKLYGGWGDDILLMSSLRTFQTRVELYGGLGKDNLYLSGNVESTIDGGKDIDTITIPKTIFPNRSTDHQVTSFYADFMDDNRMKVLIDGPFLNYGRWPYRVDDYRSYSVGFSDKQWNLDSIETINIENVNLFESIRFNTSYGPDTYRDVIFQSDNNIDDDIINHFSTNSVKNKSIVLDLINGKYNLIFKEIDNTEVLIQGSDNPKTPTDTQNTLTLIKSSGTVLMNSDSSDVKPTVGTVIYRASTVKQINILPAGSNTKATFDLSGWDTSVPQINIHTLFIDRFIGPTNVSNNINLVVNQEDINALSGSPMTLVLGNKSNSLNLKGNGVSLKFNATDGCLRAANNNQLLANIPKASNITVKNGHHQISGDNMNVFCLGGGHEVHGGPQSKLISLGGDHHFYVSGDTVINITNKGDGLKNTLSCKLEVGLPPNEQVKIIRENGNIEYHTVNVMDCVVKINGQQLGYDSSLDAYVLDLGDSGYSNVTIDCNQFASVIHPAGSKLTFNLQQIKQLVSNFASNQRGEVHDLGTIHVYYENQSATTIAASNSNNSIIVDGVKAKDLHLRVDVVRNCIVIHTVENPELIMFDGVSPHGSSGNIHNTFRDVSDNWNKYTAIKIEELCGQISSLTLREGEGENQKVTAFDSAALKQWLMAKFIVTHTDQRIYEKSEWWEKKHGLTLPDNEGYSFLYSSTIQLPLNNVATILCTKAFTYYIDDRIQQPVGNNRHLQHNFSIKVSHFPTDIALEVVDLTPQAESSVNDAYQFHVATLGNCIVYINFDNVITGSGSSQGSKHFDIYIDPQRPAPYPGWKDTGFPHVTVLVISGINRQGVTFDHTHKQYCLASHSNQPVVTWHAETIPTVVYFEDDNLSLQGDLTGQETDDSDTWSDVVLQNPSFEQFDSSSNSFPGWSILPNPKTSFSGSWKDTNNFTDGRQGIQIVNKIVRQTLTEQFDASKTYKLSVDLHPTDGSDGVEVRLLAGEHLLGNKQLSKTELESYPRPYTFHNIEFVVVGNQHRDVNGALRIELIEETIRNTNIRLTRFDNVQLRSR
ncbi:hypothetical protein AB835_06940 [Candidatus Endobugula sertula]|uniref:Uncharacterized protein n=1 Tax=Candidatus Endobugula sertula TaxID=62101 RepID=A0A1D2QQD7_9GAMM|nr:hypothetical protein AB835_06940 [Candidatus Endobugula sertula]